MTVIVTLLVVGILLMLLETLLPGLVAGLTGFGCLVASVVVAYQDFGPGTGNTVLLVAVALMILLAVFWIRYFPHSRIGRIFVAKEAIGQLGVEQPSLVGRHGTALTTLRPSGTAEIDGRRVDVVTEGGLIQADTAIEVIAVEGMRVVVREL